jgi:mannose-6-phosphate isomerase
MNDHRGKVLRVLPNRVWRTYSGGRLIDEMEGVDKPKDGLFPEDWLGSTVRAVNPGREGITEGLSVVDFKDGQARLADLIASDPVYFLGKKHVDHFGINPMVLVKYLDSSVRLPFQVHPSVEFSRRHLNAESGKTEAYYVLNTRPDVAEPYIYLGFQRPPGRRDLRHMIEHQDVEAMLRCFDKIPVSPGDIYVVPGGLPHAIGPGVLMVEVMEPTDFVARMEFSVAGRVIPESARFMGRDVDFALDMLSFDPISPEEVRARWRCQPRLIHQTKTSSRESLVDQRTTACFHVWRTKVQGEARWCPKGFTIFIVVEGSCTLSTQTGDVHLMLYDRVIVPSHLPPLTITSENGVCILECMPPEA